MSVARADSAAQVDHLPAAADVVGEMARAAAKKVKSLTGRAVQLRKQVKDPAAATAEAEAWSTKGTSLLALPRGQWHLGLTEVEVPDYANLDEDGLPVPVAVSLDPEKDFQENAKQCFKKARKITRALETIAPLLEETEAAIGRWTAEAEAAAAWESELAQSGALDPVSEEGIEKLYKAMLDEGVMKPPPPPERPPDPEEERRLAFKKKYGKDIDCFLSPGGHEVVAGRSSKMNEHVSLKLAKGDMVWFHTDGRIPGSHVLIRAPWDEVDDEDIEFAAGIAAYHSKAKHQRHVPVMYCKGHQVRKIKNTPQGMVTTTGNTFQIIVDPSLPEEEKGAARTGGSGSQGEKRPAKTSAKAGVRASGERRKPRRDMKSEVEGLWLDG